MPTKSRYQVKQFEEALQKFAHGLPKFKKVIAGDWSIDFIYADDGTPKRICADTLMLDSNLSGCNSPIWLLGNRWDPPGMTRFYMKETTITAKKFSLADYVKIAAQHK